MDAALEFRRRSFVYWSPAPDKINSIWRWGQHSSSSSSGSNFESAEQSVQTKVDSSPARHQDTQRWIWNKKSGVAIGVFCARWLILQRSAGQEHKRAISISTTNKTCARQSTADCVASTHSEYLLCAAAMHAVYMLRWGEWSPWDSRARGEKYDAYKVIDGHTKA